MTPEPKPYGELSKYKFVKGRGDHSHESQLHKAAEQGYKAKLMIFDHAGGVGNPMILVLMEKD
jgi:hypothetical protein